MNPKSSSHGQAGHMPTSGPGMLKEKYGFFFATLQMETACLDESGAEAIDTTRTASEG